MEWLIIPSANPCESKPNKMKVVAIAPNHAAKTRKRAHLVLIYRQHVNEGSE